MNWKEFENKMKQEADGYASSIDPEEFWSRLHKKKKNRTWLWVVLPILVFGISLAIYVNKLSNSKTLAFNTISTKENQISQSKNDLHNITNAKGNNLVDFNKHFNQNRMYLEAAKAKPESANISINSLQTKNETHSNILRPNISANEKSTNKLNIDRRNILSEIKTSRRNSRKTKTPNQNLNKHKVLFSSLDNQILNEENDAQTASGSTNIIFDKLEVQTLKLKPFSTLYNEFNKDDEFVNAQTKSITIEKPLLNNKSNLLVGIYSGYGFFKSALTTKDSFLTSLVSDRKVTETNIDLYQAGVRVQFEKGFLKHFATGIQYTQLNTRFNWERKWVSKTLDSIPTPNFYSNGSVDTSFYPGMITTIYHRQVEHYNYFRSIQIPVYYSPYFLQLGKLALRPAFALITNVWQSAEGKIIGIDGPIKLAEMPVHKQGLGFSGEINFQLFYELGAKSGMFVEAFYNTDLSNRLRSDYNIEQKFQSYGLRVAWVKKF